DVEKKIRQGKKEVQEISKKETSVLGELDETNRNLSGKRAELKRIEARLEGLRKNLTGLNTGIEGLKDQRTGLILRVRKRLKAMYKMEKGDAMATLISDGSGQDAGRRLRYLVKVMDADAMLLNGYEDNFKALTARRKRLLSLKKEIEEARAGVEAAKNEVAAVQAKKAGMLAQVRTEKDKKLDLLEGLEQSASSIKEMLNRLNAQPDAQGDLTGFASMKGRLRMPVDGNISSSYGSVRHPKFKTVIFNNGVVIDALAGTPAKSVYAGKVVYAGWLKGYGEVVIIDHGRGYYTLFGYLSGIFKSLGAEVADGEDIGLVGDSGISTAPGLYFEIRHRGSPKDPQQWFAARQE
ncbi:MAG: peptidoglycan DD-metalloendopeptidase family protein, partial [Deltaproteobacteria bacterium]